MKILIVKTSSLGDIIHTFPVLSYLHQKFPTAEIDWIVEKSGVELVDSHPFVSRVIPIDTKAWRTGGSLSIVLEAIKDIRRHRYDVVFDLQGNIKSGLVTLFTRSSHKIGMAYDSVPEWPNLFFTNWKGSPPRGKNIREDLLYLVKTYFSDHSEYYDSPVRLSIPSEEQERIQTILSNPIVRHKKVVLVCPGSAWENKQLSLLTLTNWLKHLEAIHSCSFILCWGSDKEKSVVEKLQSSFPERCLVLDKMSLPALQGLMSRVDLVVAMDSLPLHLAGTAGTATASAFGPSSSTKYSPIGSEHVSTQGTCPYGVIFEKRCPQLRTCTTGACMKEMSVEELISNKLH